MASQPGRSAVRLGGLLYQAHVVARRTANEALRDLGLELRDLGILELLSDRRSWTQHQLGERLGIDKSAMVRIVDALEQADLVSRRRRGDDRRAYSVTITNAGRGRMVDAYERAAASMDGLLAGFSGTDRHTLGELLERIVRAQPVID